MTEQRTETGPVTAAGRDLVSSTTNLKYIRTGADYWRHKTRKVEQEAWNCALAAVEAKVVGLRHQYVRHPMDGGDSEDAAVGDLLNEVSRAIEELRHD